ncbi:hypothetical protein BGX28_001176 [Mortierella sp. GBA30]|nr:hypothetical protein BGX28_001176 [Mortierella sp. GBA30]
MLAQSSVPTAVMSSHYSESLTSHDHKGAINAETATSTSEPTSLSEQYQTVILNACEEAMFGKAGGEHVRATFSYFKDDKLRQCCGIPTKFAESRVAPDVKTQREHYRQILPDPELKHPVSRRVIGEFVKYYSTQESLKEEDLPYKATAALLSSYRSKVLLETTHYANEIPKPPKSEVETPIEELAAAFMRSTVTGPLDDATFEGDHYLWASQYAAVRELSGAGKIDNGISYREEMKKPLEAMHSSSTISLTIATCNSVREDPILRKKIFTLGWAWVSDSDWAEAQQHQRHGHGAYQRNIDHILLGQQAQNASLGYEKISEVIRQEKGTLIRPAWLCFLTPAERQRLLLAQCYADFHVNCEVHEDLILEEGYRSRYRLSNMVFGALPDSYDEWTIGEANNGAMLCADCVSTEFKSTLAPELWDSEDFNFLDRWQYSAQLYFYHSARHNYTLARFIRFQPDMVEDILAQYKQFPFAVPRGKKNNEYLVTITKAIGLKLPTDDEFADRIARSYDWASISGLCAHCLKDKDTADEWYAATLGTCLAARHLSLTDKARLGTYLDAAGFNVFPALFRSYNSQCGCVGRWVKRLHMVAFQACELYTTQAYSAVIALRVALADQIKGLDDHAIADLLRGVKKEILVGRQLGREYRARREQDILMARQYGTQAA